MRRSVASSMTPCRSALVWPWATISSPRAAQAASSSGAWSYKAVFAMEELEAAARLTILCRDQSPRALTRAQVEALVKAFRIEL